MKSARPSLLRVSLLVIAGAWLAAGPAAAQNLAPNSRFDTNITGWPALTGNGTVAWDASDAHGASYSGSLAITNQTTTGSGPAALGVLRCISASPGQYTARAFYFIPPGQANAGSVNFWIYAFPTAGCGGSATIIPSGDLTATGQWRVLSFDVTLPPGTASVLLWLAAIKNQPGGQFAARFDDVYFGKPCHQSSTNLCVSGNRYGIQAAWRTSAGQTGSGTPVPLTSDTGYFWFFAPSNVEAVIKVLDACSYNRKFWVYAGGLTDVKVDLTLTDFETNTVKTYSNPLGKPFQPIQDTNAFATCP